MNEKFSESVFLITSSDSELDAKKKFGTGFVIHQHEQTTYFLTCAHVVEAVGGLEKVKVSGHRAKVIEPLGEKLGCDLAVLAVEGELTHIAPFKLGVIADKGNLFEAAGFYQDGTNTRKLAEISGKLGGTQIIEDKEGNRTPAWDLEISDDSEHELKAGYSGSPAVDKTSGYVFGVVAQLISQGKGLAISIEALKKVWQEMPESLIHTEKPVNQPAKANPYSSKSKRWLDYTLNRICKDLDIEKKQDEYLTEEITKIQQQLRMVGYGLDQRSLQRQLEDAKEKRNLCLQQIEAIEDQEEEILKEIERRKNNNSA